MLKGIQKNMVWIKTPQSRYFEAAYFIMRPSPVPPKASEGEMLLEANRIIKESDPVRSRKRVGKQQKKAKIYAFFCGLLTGSAIIAVCWLTTLLTV